MKKIIPIALCIIMMLTITSCTAQPKASANIEGELSEIFKKIYEGADTEAPMTMETEINGENKEYVFGTTQVQYNEGLVSDAMIMTIPHSIVLIRVDGTQDIEKTKQLIRDNADPYKWICVGVEEDQVIVDSIGDLIFFAMSADAKEYHKSFLALA